MSGGGSGSGSSSGSLQASGSDRGEVPRQLNESLHELHRPEGTPSMILLFFHGLQSGDDFSDAHLSTWKTSDGTIWPREWLPREFPGAHILTVSYPAGVRKPSHGHDMYIIVENLISDLMGADIGQTRHCPVVLVGHCFGGLVIKQICLESSKPINNCRDGERAKPKTFLDNVKGIFYYGTPHRGSPFISKQADVHDSPLLKYFRILSSEAGRLNYEFDHLRRLHANLRVHGLGESLPSESGLFPGIVAAPEASAREGDCFNVIKADHISISKPSGETDRRFYGLTHLLKNVARDFKEEAGERELTSMRGARPANFQSLPDQLVDIETQVHEIAGKLGTVRRLGLRGMGGVGKTTLAMAVFNELAPQFEYSCFVPDVKLLPGTVDDVKEAVWKLMYCFGQKVKGEPNFFSLQGKRLLLVLDDIGYRDEKILQDMANVCSVDSRYIVTSRDQDLLRSLDEVHVVPFLNRNSAKTLFMNYAFKKHAISPIEFEVVMEAIVTKCEGLPLALEVLGKYLETKQDHKDWTETFNALEKAEEVTSINERLWKILKLSYDGLRPQEQQMFLDATTFFNNSHSWNLRLAKVAWSAAYNTTSVGLLWKTLVDMSLVYNVEEDAKIKVHQQLRSLGQRIASEPQYSGTCRVWKRKIALELLQSTENLAGEEIHALRFNDIKKGYYSDNELEEIYALQSTNSEEGGSSDNDSEEGGSSDIDSQDGGSNGSIIRIKSIALRKLRKLQFLETNVRVTIDGVEKGAAVPTKLVLLKCIGDKLFDPTVQTGLVILSLSHVGSFPLSIGQLRSLKYLNIRCSPFHNLPKSFGRLKALEYLVFSDCHDLESLPESFGRLSALKHLEFYGCYRLDTLPESFGQLSALNRLHFWNCDNLHTLPESFGQLSALNRLQFWNCDNLHTLPESFGQLSALNFLELYGCSALHTLPESFGQLSALNHLEFSKCFGLYTLPESFGQLSALNHLEFYGCYNLHTLPESFGQLPALNRLKFSNCKDLHILPESFGQLSALNRLHFWNCDNLHTLPESFGQLSALNHLEFYHCYKLLTLPESFGQLSALNHLEFYGCYNLHTLPESFGQLSALNRLEFSDCEKLHTLPESFGQLSALNHLHFWNCDNLHTLPESFGQLSALNHLEFFGCDKLHTLPESFGQLAALNHLEF